MTPAPELLTRGAFLLLTYLFAAVPFGVVLTTLYGGQADIRQAGSRNIGATNVARVYGHRLGLQVALLDAFKGFFPVALALWGLPSQSVVWPGLVLVTAFVGHCYPVYLEFRGGKGVATAAGGLLALSPWTILAGLLIWLALLWASGRSSVAALGAAAALIGLAVVVHPAILPIVGVLVLGVLTTHVPNLRRLIRGEENTVVRPVHWSHRSERDPEALLAEGPAGGTPPPDAWPTPDREEA